MRQARHRTKISCLLSVVCCHVLMVLALVCSIPFPLRFRFRLHFRFVALNFSIFSLPCRPDFHLHFLPLLSLHYFVIFTKFFIGKLYEKKKTKSEQLISLHTKAFTKKFISCFQHYFPGLFFVLFMNFISLDISFHFFFI